MNKIELVAFWLVVFGGVLVLIQAWKVRNN